MNDESHPGPERAASVGARPPLLVLLIALSCTATENDDSTRTEPEEPTHEQVFLGMEPRSSAGIGSESAVPPVPEVPSDGSPAPAHSGESQSPEATSPGGSGSATQPDVEASPLGDGGTDTPILGDAEAPAEPSLGGTVCEGYAPRLETEMHCLSSADCPAGEVCGEPPPADPCPPWNGDDLCIGKSRGDACADGRVCMQLGCPPLTCEAVCSEENCNGTWHCVEGSCVAKPCAQGGSCPPRYRCEADAGDGGGACVPIPCDDTSCPVFMACRPDAEDADEYGCVNASCTRDADCGCGFCIESRCLPRQGLCH